MSSSVNREQQIVSNVEENSLGERGVGKKTHNEEEIATDSGFICVPQGSHSNAASDDDIVESIPREQDLDRTIPTMVKDHSAEETQLVFDSGCIDEVDEELSRQKNEKVAADLLQRFNELQLENEAAAVDPEHPDSAANESDSNQPSLIQTIMNEAKSANSTTWEKFYQQNDDGNTPLHLSCMYGCIDVVGALIRMTPHPCLLNVRNDDGETPLHLAVESSHPEIVRLLIMAGAEFNIRERTGNTALHLACMNGDKVCVRALLHPIDPEERKDASYVLGGICKPCRTLPIDLEISNYDGEKCVHLAAEAGDIEILRLLIANGANINAREGKAGRTPLHIAIEKCDMDLVTFLTVCDKMDMETPTYGGLTAYQIACILQKTQMLTMLKEHGAEAITPPDSDCDDSSDMDTDLESSDVGLTS